MSNINIIQTDITEIESGIIGHGVNCQHAFGSGVAGSIKDKWPIVRERFLSQPRGKQMLGKIDLIPINDVLTVCNMYTQEYYGYDGKQYASLSAVQYTLLTLCFHAQQQGVDNIYIPQIGCKRGGLDWDTEVFPIVNSCAQHFEEEMTINVCIYNG